MRQSSASTRVTVKRGRNKEGHCDDKRSCACFQEGVEGITRKERDIVLLEHGGWGALGGRAVGGARGGGWMDVSNHV